MTESKVNNELVQMLADARLSARLQLLEVLEAKLDCLTANNATRDQILSTLKGWILIRQATNFTKQEEASHG